MNTRQFDQIKSYSKLLVYELHKTIFDEVVFDRLKATLLLAEEFECFVMEIELKQKEKNNVVPIIRLA